MTSTPLALKLCGFLYIFILITNAASVGLGNRTGETDLAFMKELLEGGKVTPTIDRRYSLSELPDALRHLEKGHARGKIIITM
jgi:NADPH:quinone reductase-like Zn-dependent oxidoreductase